MKENKRIKYLSHYGCKEKGRIRFNSPASDTKKDYYFEVLNECGYAVDHISRAACSEKGSHSWSYVEKRGENTFRYFASWCLSTNRYLQGINKAFVHVQWFLWRLIHLKRGEQIMVYHSLAYDKTLMRLKKWRGLRIIGDIEELYQDVHPQTAAVCRNEYKFIETCDKYIFPNTLLNKQLNKENRPFAIVHGIYKVCDYVPVKFDDSLIHLLYSGTFDPVKGGALAAIRCYEYLSDNYQLHITGFGTASQEQMIKKAIDEVNEKSESKIDYFGFLSDEKLLDLMHKCHIGLCTQDPNNKLNLTSFPSKILNYMGNGLIVLVGRNRVIEESAVGDIVCYYDEQTPKAIAESIKNINLSRKDEGIARLKKLNGECVLSMRQLIERE